MLGEYSTIELHPHPQALSLHFNPDCHSLTAANLLICLDLCVIMGALG